MLECKNCGGLNVKITEGKTRTNYYCTDCQSRNKPIITDSELVSENVRLAKQKQHQQDSNRIERKAFREHARVENAYTEYVKALDSSISKLADRFAFKLNERINLYENSNDEVGLIQLSDLHLNEIVNSAHNKFDMKVASKRLAKLAVEACNTFSARGISNVVVALTGDLLNSDRRLDELLSQATNRAMATVISTELITQFLLDIASMFNITVVSTLGNEGRADKDWSWNNVIASNNYDFTIVAMARKIIQTMDIPLITFGSIDQYELVVNINGQNVLFTHDVSKQTSVQSKTQSLIGRYKLAGIDIDCVFSGHLHASRNTDLSYRSSSLVGSNDYNEKALNLIGRAAQNIAIFGKDYRYVTSIDLQNTGDIDGYDIDYDLMEYNARSASKLIDKRTIMEVKV